MPEWMDAARFAEYAERALDRWRQIVGHTVIPVDAAWGSGIVEGAAWQPAGRGTPEHIQLRIRYAEGFPVTVIADAFATFHSKVSIPDESAAFIRQWFADGVDRDVRMRELKAHTRALREARDRELLARVKSRAKRRPQSDT